jgi:hypothetical protein
MAARLSGRDRFAQDNKALGNQVFRNMLPKYNEGLDAVDDPHLI